jgi:hypothetical protein
VAPKRVWTGAKNLHRPPPGFDPRTVQPIANQVITIKKAIISLKSFNHVVLVMDSVNVYCEIGDETVSVTVLTPGFNSSSND